MLTFFDWIVHRDAAALLRLLEAAGFFDPQSYNPVFEKELGRIPDSEARRQAVGMRGFDFGNYIARSLARAGFKDDDVQEHFQSIVVGLLVSPGRLFAGWEPGKHGPLERRFRRSVWNAIRNAQEKTRNRRKWMVAADPSVMAERLPGRQPYSSQIDEFRGLVAQRLGKLALAILDQRLSGEDTKELVRTGTGSAYYVKREMREIKKLAERFAARLGDPAFAKMVAGAMEQEAETVAKRQAALAARRAAG